jgi:hypothetical protein
MANEYDLIFKENLEAFFLPLFAEITQTDLSKTEELNLELQATLERKADFLKKVLTDKPYILHLEIQSKNDARMLSRMVFYHALLREKYKYTLPVKQYVLYIGKEKMSMRQRDDDFPNTFQYHLIDVRDFSYQAFLQSDVPEMVVLSILADFQSQSPDIILQDILTRLTQLLPEDGRLYNYMATRSVIEIARLNPPNPKPPQYHACYH